MPFAIPVSTPSSTSGSSTQAWTKISKSYTDFSIADTTKQVNLMTLAASTLITHIIVNVTTAFNDGGVNSAYISQIGATPAQEGWFFGAIGNLSAAGQVSASGSNAGKTNDLAAALNNGTLTYGGAKFFSMVSSTTVTINVDASVNLNTMTQGAMVIYILTDTLPA